MGSFSRVHACKNHDFQVNVETLQACVAFLQVSSNCSFINSVNEFKELFKALTNPESIKPTPDDFSAWIKFLDVFHSTWIQECEKDGLEVNLNNYSAYTKSYNSTTRPRGRSFWKVMTTVVQLDAKETHALIDRFDVFFCIRISDTFF